MNGGQNALFDPEALEQHFGNRRQTVGGATGIRDDMMLSSIIFFIVHAHADGNIFTLGWRADDHLFGAGTQMQGRFFAGGKKPGALDDDIDTHIAPRQFAGVALGADFHTVAIDNDVAAIHAHIPFINAIVAVILEEMSVCLHITQIVDSNQVKFTTVLFKKRLGYLTANTAKAIDRNFCSHDISFTAKIFLFGTFYIIQKHIFWHKSSQ